MASLRKKLRSPYWFACFYLPSGGRTQRSTKLTERKKAMKLALQWEEAAAKRITEAQARRVLSDIYESIHGAQLASPAVKDFAQQWLARKEKEVSQVSYASYKGAVDKFVKSIGDKAGDPLHYITPAQVAAWRDKAAAKTTARTANNKLKVIRVMFQSAWRDGLLTDNPAAKVTALRAESGTRRAFTLPELKRILANASMEWRGMILAGIYTGQRLKDIASLTWANVDIAEEQLTLTTSKTGRHQVIPIARPLLSYIEELPACDNPAAPLFPSAHPLAIRAGGTAALSQQFHAILASVGLAKARPAKHSGAGKGRDTARETGSVSFHSLRHTATSLLKRAGVSEAVARDLIGHESAEISRHYTHIDTATKRKAIAMLPDIFAVKK
ncbi:MAG: tyrosine-type recombinase/integrase [Opitutaceae bacterium]|jgi:integrase|nr:tyrosine-type recombinase/integrase [Opitutaceae bacterium]